MFEYLCPTCATSTQVPSIPDGTLVPCTHCGQRLCVVQEAEALEQEGDMSLVQEGAAVGAPAESSGPRLIGVCGGAGLTVAAVILLLWALLDRGPAEAGRPGEQAVARTDKAKERPADGEPPAPKVVQEVDPPEKVDKGNVEEKNTAAEKQPEHKNGERKLAAEIAGREKKEGAKKGPGWSMPPPVLTPEQVYAKTLKSTVWILAGNRMGSGSLIHREQKVVLTNEHVVGSSTEVRVFFPEYQPDGKFISEGEYYRQVAKKGGGLRGKLVAKSPLLDLALICLEGELPAEVQPLPFSTRKISENQAVLSIGNPASSAGKWINSPGIIRGIYRDTWSNRNPINGAPVERQALVIETQSPIDPGDSGGPLVNGQAELIGVLHGYRTDARLRTTYIHLDDVKKMVKTAGYSWVDAQVPVVKVLEIAEMRKALTDKDLKIARTAAAHLAHLGPEARPAVDDLIKALKHEDSEVRYLCCRALGQIGEKAGHAAEHVARLLENPQDRVEALNALARLGSAASVAVPEVTKWLDDSEKEVQESALRVLLNLGPKAGAAVPDLARLLPRADPKHKLLIVETLGAIGPNAAPAGASLGDVLLEQAGDWKLRSAALRSLWRIGPGSRAALPAVRGALKDSDLRIRQSSIVMLEKIGGGDEGDKSTVAIFQALGPNPSAQLREDAMLTWKAFGLKARFAIPYLRSLTAAKNPPTLRKLADETLQKTGDVVQTSDLPLFLSAFADRELTVHARAYAGRVVLEHAGPKAEVPVLTLLQLLRETDFELRGLAALVVGKLGPRAKEAIPALVRLLSDDKDNEISVRLKVVIALRSLGTENPEAVVPALSQTLRDPSTPVRFNAAIALAAIGPKAADAVPNLILGLEDADRAVRSQSAWTLGQIGPKAARAVQALTAAVYNQDTDLRRNAVLALGAIGPDAAPAVKALLFCLGDTNLRKLDSAAFAELWGAAVNSLAKIGEPARKKIFASEILKEGKNADEVTGAVLAIVKSRPAAAVKKTYAKHIEKYVLARLLYPDLRRHQLTAKAYERAASTNRQAAQVYRQAVQEAQHLEGLIRMVREAVAELKE